MFQSVSVHSSEQTIAHYRSRLTVSQIKGVSDTISKRLENHQPQRTQISTANNAPFIRNSNRMVSKLTASFPSVFVQQYSRQLPSFSAHRSAPMTENRAGGVVGCFDCCCGKLCGFQNLDQSLKTTRFIGV